MPYKYIRNNNQEQPHRITQVASIVFPILMYPMIQNDNLLDKISPEIPVINNLSGQGILKISQEIRIKHSKEAQKPVVKVFIESVVKIMKKDQVMVKIW